MLTFVFLDCRFMAASKVLGEETVNGQEQRAGGKGEK